MATEFSIIVCTYNRLDCLKKCIHSLLDLDYDNYEIIIINDCSNDGTGEYLMQLNNPKIRAFHNEQNSGLSYSRNVGVKLAKYEILAFTDDDCLADKNWLKELLKPFEDENISFVIGCTVYVGLGYKGYFPERLINNQNAKWQGGGNIAHRKKVFDVCGVFDDDFFKYNNEDTEFAIRAVSRGFLYDRAPKAYIFHQAMEWTPTSLLKSAVNPSVWPVLKKKYPGHYLCFNPDIKFGIIIFPKDYLYLLLSPVLISILLIRYLMHGKKNLKIFFLKWPVLLILKRYNIYKEAIKQRVFMI